MVMTVNERKVISMEGIDRLKIFFLFGGATFVLFCGIWMVVYPHDPEPMWVGAIWFGIAAGGVRAMMGNK